MNVGDYVRTNSGYMRKIIAIYNGYVEVNDKCFNSYANVQIENDDIKKSSPNIIDLIEVGDYVNGCPVLHKENNELVCGLLLRYKEENIENIVTKEQFESMEYKVGD